MIQGMTEAELLIEEVAHEDFCAALADEADSTRDDAWAEVWGA